jgi:hypothetical protein
VFPVAVAAAATAGWLLLFFVLLALPPGSQPSAAQGVAPGTEPPAAVSLLAKRFDQDGFGVTLADLAARGWFGLSGTPGPGGPLAVAWTLAIIFGPFALIGGVAWLFAAGLGWLGERLIGLAAAAVLVGVVIWIVRRLTPRFAEFDGQVIRQTFYESDEGPDEHKVVVDDGVRATAWDLKIPAGAWRQMPPGTLVHARVNLHNREVTIHPVEPPAVFPAAGRPRRSVRSPRRGR